MKPSKIIFAAFAIIVAIILVSSFALSYSNLRETAIEAGIDPFLAPLWPVCLDCFLVLASLFILRANLAVENPKPGWCVLLVFTTISTIFNVIHSPENLLAQSAHAIPPIALCVSLELLMMILKSDLSLETTQPKDDSPRTKSKKSKLKNENTDRIQNYFLEHPNASINAARKALSVSWHSVKKYKTRETKNDDNQKL